MCPLRVGIEATRHVATQSAEAMLCPFVFSDIFIK